MRNILSYEEFLIEKYDYKGVGKGAAIGTGAGALLGGASAMYANHRRSESPRP